MCDSDNQYFVGEYTSNGQTVTYTQPPESLGPITSIPFTAPIPSSSNCVTYQSSELFAALATVGISGSQSAPTASATASGKSGSASGSATRTGSSASASATGGSSQNSGAGALETSIFATVAGVFLAVTFFA